MSYLTDLHYVTKWAACSRLHLSFMRTVMSSSRFEFSSRLSKYYFALYVLNTDPFWWSFRCGDFYRSTTAHASFSVAYVAERQPVSCVNIWKWLTYFLARKFWIYFRVYYRSELVQSKALLTLGVFVVDASHREQVCSRVFILLMWLCKKQTGLCTGYSCVKLKLRGGCKQNKTSAIQSKSLTSLSNSSRFQRISPCSFSENATVESMMGESILHIFYEYFRLDATLWKLLFSFTYFAYWLAGVEAFYNAFSHVNLVGF